MAATNWTAPGDWGAVLQAEFLQPYFAELKSYVEAQRAAGPVFPPAEDQFAALAATPLASVKAVILGQDPYHGAGQAHGLSFSVRPGVTHPASLVNIFKEYQADLGFPKPKSGCLLPWAERGVLLLNAVLTVRSGEPNSHKNRGWERLTDAIVRAVHDRPGKVAFVLWGAYAQKKGTFIDAERHFVLKSAHPSPLSASQGFFGSKPFTQVNAALASWGETPVDWRLE